MSQKRHTAEQIINWDSPCESSNGTTYFVKVNIAENCMWENWGEYLRKRGVFPVDDTHCEYAKAGATKLSVQTDA